MDAELPSFTEFWLGTWVQVFFLGKRKKNNEKVGYGKLAWE